MLLLLLRHGGNGAVGAVGGAAESNGSNAIWIERRRVSFCDELKIEQREVEERLGFQLHDGFKEERVEACHCGWQLG